MLVVIAIIGVLVALLLPAIQAARESARRDQCASNLRQVGLAVQASHDSHHRYPAGRDGGTPYDLAWAFKLLPFMEQESIFKSWDASQPAHSTTNATAMRTPVSTFYCPSRRDPASDRDFVPRDATSPRGVAAGGDYAANTGRDVVNFGVDSDGNSLAQIDRSKAGPMFTKSRVRDRQATDGLSKTIAIGERHLPLPSAEVSPEQTAVALGDTAFFCGDLAETVLRTSKGGVANGESDSSAEKFGSVHPSICNFVFLDGHVSAISIEVDARDFALLSSIGDGENVVEN